MSIDSLQGLSVHATKATLEHGKRLLTVFKTSMKNASLACGELGNSAKVSRQAPGELLSQVGENLPDAPPIPLEIPSLISVPDINAPSGIVSGLINPSEAGSERKDIYARQIPEDILNQITQNAPNFSLPESLSNLIPNTNGSNFLNPSGISSGFLNPGAAGSEQKEVYARQAPEAVLNQLTQNAPDLSLPDSFSNWIPKPNGSNFLNTSGISSGFLNPSGAGSELKEIHTRQAPEDILNQLTQNAPDLSLPDSFSNWIPKPNGSNFLNTSGISSGFLNPSGAGSELKEIHTRQAPEDILNQLTQNAPDLSLPDSFSNWIPKPNGSNFLNTSGISSGFLNPSGAGSELKEIHTRQAPEEILNQLTQNAPNFSLPDSFSNWIPKPNGSNFLNNSGISSGFLNPSGAGSELKEIYTRQAPEDILNQLTQNAPNFSLPDSFSNWIPKPNGSNFLNTSGISSGFLNPSGAGSEQKDVYARQAPEDILNQLTQNAPNFSLPDSFSNWIPKPNGSNFLNPTGISSGLLNPGGAGSEQKDVYARQAPEEILNQLTQNAPNFSLPDSLSNLIPKPNGSSFLNPSGISSSFLNPNGAGSEIKEMTVRKVPVAKESRLSTRQDPDFFNEMTAELSNLFGNSSGDNSDLLSSLMEN
ncbi:hypothetical protein AAG570_009669 [Ranatra chinensis]|uniref:Uncharacterized protein n=1 Tax=Ranatra chinensis TaxID=642074 RepID=A0ABD0YRW6_9HEMI